MAELVQGVEQLWLLVSQVFLAGLAFLHSLGIPAPVGVLGLWRWGIWIFRRAVGSFYRPLPVVPGFQPTTSVITPVYNEVPDVFLAALRSWAQSKPTEIIAVIDHSDHKCMEIFRGFTEECEAGGHTTARMIITEKPGKRPALVDGMAAAAGEIFCLVDSDTIWAADNLPKILAPFVDPRVGGVTTRQNVLAPNSTAQRLFDVYLDIRYIDEIRFLTAFGDAVTCLSGRTAVYRREAALPALPGLLNETFLGKKVISGDDKALTLLVQAAGWSVRYQETAQVFTPGATELRVFLKQRLRWARNSWRADLKALFSRWVWRKPLLAFHLIDRLLQPLTTLVAPLYIFAAAYHGHWLAIIVVISWWFLSRAIKILPHLRRRWSNIQILPWYIFFNYWSAVLKIYAFFTMNQQGWITRWNQNRMSLLGPLRLVPGYLGTTSTVSILAVVVFLRTLSIDTVALPATAEQSFQPEITTASRGEESIASSAIFFNTIQLQPLQAETPAQEAQAWAPIFSPDGRQIVFVSDQLGEPQLFLRDPMTGRLRLVRTVGHLKSTPVWSPDSDKVAFVVEREGETGVEIINFAEDQTQWLSSQASANQLFFTWRLDSQTVVLSDLLGESVAAPTLITAEPGIALASAATPNHNGEPLGMVAPGDLPVDLAVKPIPVDVTSSAVAAPVSALDRTLGPVRGQPVRLTAATDFGAASPLVKGGVKGLLKQLTEPSLALRLTPPLPSVAVAPAFEEAVAAENAAAPAEPTLLRVSTSNSALAALLEVSVPEEHDVYARATWDITSESLMLLPSGMRLGATGRSLDSAWVQIILPNQRLAWVLREAMLIDATALQPLPVVVLSQ